MMRHLAAVLTLVALSACTMAEVQTNQARIEAAIVEGCGAVNAAAAIAAPFAAIPQVGAILGFAQAGCGTAGAVSALVTKALDDPRTILWTQRLAGQIPETVATVRGRL
jgi:hypothetical protein